MPRDRTPRAAEVREPLSRIDRLLEHRVRLAIAVLLARWDRTAGMLIASEAGAVTGMLPSLGPSGEGVIAAPPALYDGLRSMIDELLPQ